MILPDPLGSRVANSCKVIPIENDLLKHVINFVLRRRRIHRRSLGKEPLRRRKVDVGYDTTSQRQCFKGDSAEGRQHELVQHGMARKVRPPEILFSHGIEPFCPPFKAEAPDQVTRGVEVASPGNHHKLRRWISPAYPRKCSDESIVSLYHAGISKQPVLPGGMKKHHSIIRWPDFTVAMPKFDKPFFVKCVRKGRESIFRNAEALSCLHAIQIGDKYMVGTQKDRCRQSSRYVVDEWDCSQGAVLIGNIGLPGQQRPRAIR